MSNYGNKYTVFNNCLDIISSYRNYNILPIKIKEKNISSINYFNLIIKLPSLNFNFDIRHILLIKINEINIKILHKNIGNTFITEYIKKSFKNKKIGYFLLCLIFSLFNTFTKMIIRGGFIRNMFINDESITDIDLDIYVDEFILVRIINSLKKFDKYNKNKEVSFLDYKTYVNSIIDLIVNNLFRLIFNKSINIESIISYKIITYVNKKTDCLSFKYRIDNIVLSIDINFIGKHSFCTNSDIKSYNIDYEQNGIQLKLINNKLSCDVFRKYNETNNYIKKELNKINSSLIITSFFNIKKLFNNITTIIESFLGIEYIFLLKIIFTITKRIMYPSHVLCTNNKPLCIHNDKLLCECTNCFEIYKKMYLRHTKFSTSYNVHSYVCNKKYCTCSGIINNNLIIDNNHILLLYYKSKSNIPYNLFAEEYCSEYNLPTSIIDFNTIEKKIVDDSYKII